jgi:hypothetical protein
VIRWLRRRRETPPPPAPARPAFAGPRLSSYDRDKTNEVLTDAARIHHRDLDRFHAACTEPVIAWRVRWDATLAAFNVTHVFPGLSELPDDGMEEYHQVGSRPPHKGALAACYDDMCGQAFTHFRHRRWVHHCGIPSCSKYLVPAPVESNVRAFPL